MRHFFFALLFLLATASAATAQTRSHIVQAGETLYSISRSYGLTVDQLKAANPSLGETLLSGQTLTIPSVSTSAPVTSTPKTTAGQTRQCKQMYEVEKKETVYSISHKFGISEEEFRAANPDIKKDKVKKGQYVCIPYTAAERAEMARQQAEQQERERQEAQRKAEAAARKARMKRTVNVAVILPFGLDSEAKSKEAVKMIDFYEGFLLAVDDMKAKGVNVNVYAYDEKDTYASSLDSILATPMLSHQDLIIGPMYRQHLSTLARFANQHKIPLAVPFSTRAAAIASSPTLFQVNTSTSSLYSEVYSEFLDRNSQSNIIFLYQSDKDSHADYIIGFKNAMRDRELVYRTADMSDAQSLVAALDSVRPNVIVPSSSSQNAFEKLYRALEKTEGVGRYNISLFGYPEWQTYNDANTRALRKYRASFFATFHTNPQASDVQAFDRKFLNWFKREQTVTVPRYGLLGYDVGRYFLKGIHEYGDQFMQHQQDISVPALQNPMRFRFRNGAFVNTSIRIIRL